jgi:hypothetical protein
MMRRLAFPLVRWLKAAAWQLKHFRRYVAEFPAASQIADQLERTSQGSRAVGCASIDALRPSNHGIITKDKYEISIIREKLARRARPFPTKKWRRPIASATFGAESCAEEGPLVKDRCLFRRRKECGKASGAEWFASATRTAASGIA